MIYICLCWIYLGKGIQVPALPWPGWPGSGSGWGESVRRVSQSQSFALSVLSHKGKYKQDDYLACATVSVSARVWVCVWLYLTVSLTVCAAGSAQLLWHWLSRWAKQCVGPWSWFLGLGCGLGLWVSVSVSVLGLCLYVCLGSWSWVLCLSLSCFQLHCCQCYATPRPLSATWLNCLDLSRFAVFILRSAMSAGCLSVYLSVRPPLGAPPCSSSFLLFSLPYFHLTPTLLVLSISISGCLPVPSVCLSLSPTACRPSVYFGHPQSYFQFSQVIESTQILLV